VVTIPGHLTFQRGRTSGEGVGATYDRNKGIVVIQDQSKARVGPDAKGTGSAEASSKRMVMERGLHSLQLEEGARIVSQDQTLTGAKAAMLFTEDDTALKFLELRGSARVDPTPGSPANQPAMSADEISMGFHPDGQTLQHARLTGQGVLTLRGCDHLAIDQGLDDRSVHRHRWQDACQSQCRRSCDRGIAGNRHCAGAHDHLTDFEGDRR
jgi:hypothetical protein